MYRHVHATVPETWTSGLVLGCRYGTAPSTVPIRRVFCVCGPRSAQTGNPREFLSFLVVIGHRSHRVIGHQAKAALPFFYVYTRHESMNGVASNRWQGTYGLSLPVPVVVRAVHNIIYNITILKHVLLCTTGCQSVRSQEDICFCCPRNHVCIQFPTHRISCIVHYGNSNSGIDCISLAKRHADLI